MRQGPRLPPARKLAFSPGVPSAHRAHLFLILLRVWALGALFSSGHLTSTIIAGEEGQGEGEESQVHVCLLHWTKNLKSPLSLTWLLSSIGYTIDIIQEGLKWRVEGWITATFATSNSSEANLLRPWLFPKVLQKSACSQYLKARLMDSLGILEAY